MTTRRQFFQGTLALTAGAALAPVFAESNTAPSAKSVAGLETARDPKLSAHGKLLQVGFGAKRASSQPTGTAPSTSVITEISLHDFAIKQRWVNLPNAHSILTVSGNQQLVLPLDGKAALLVQSQATIGEQIAAPNGYLYSGHGLKLDDLVYVTLRKEHATSATDTGLIGVLDIPRRRIVQLLNSGAVRPHDLVAIDHGRHLAVSHYGDLNYDVSGQTSANMREPKLVIIAVKSGRILQTLVAPDLGSLTHIAVSDDSIVCGVPLNYFGFDDQGRRGVERTLGAPQFEISVAEELEGRLAEPMPIFLFDLASGGLRSVDGVLAKQRRAQSVVYHRASRQFLITYTFSDSLAVVDDSAVRHVSAFDLGLNYIRGVTPIGDSDLVAVSGGFRGVALLRVSDLQVVKRLDVSLFDSPHVRWEA